jgi:TRAP-type C4-dicarboxylate transport system permease small subunit
MSQPAKAEPVRVRLYGLVSLTKRRYLAQLAVAVVLAAGLMALWYFRWPTVRRTLLAAQTPLMDRAVDFWDAAPWVIGALAALQAVEAFFVLRALRQKEAEVRAPALPPAGPSGPAYAADKPPEGG